MVKIRTYSVIVQDRKTGQRTVVCPGPFTHREACAVLSKFTKHSWRLEMVEEIV
jgi:hypothetical protein